MYYCINYRNNEFSKGKFTEDEQKHFGVINMTWKGYFEPKFERKKVTRKANKNQKQNKTTKDTSFR